MRRFDPVIIDLYGSRLAVKKLAINSDHLSYFFTNDSMFSVHQPRWSFFMVTWPYLLFLYSDLSACQFPWLSLPDLFSFSFVTFISCRFHSLSFAKQALISPSVPICYLFCWYVTVTVLYLHYVTIIDCWSSSFSYDLISFVIFLPHLSFSLAVTSAPLNWDTWWQIWARSWRTKK